MFSVRPRVRVVGRGMRLRVRVKGDWDADPEAALRVTCRASVAMDAE
jgi:hypothetical protein